MSNVGMNTSAAHLGGCGGMPPAAAAAAAPIGMPVGFVGGGFAIPAPGLATAAMAMPMPAPERFASSMAGGVILGKDGAPAGRIPAGSFVDTKDGTIFGPDGKALALPEGATADFFDLPDVKELMEMTRMATAEAARAAELATTSGGGHTKSSTPDGKTAAGHTGMQSFVDGQWGPGGVTPIKGGGGAAAAAGCDSEHGATTKAGGATSTGTTVANSGATSAVAGASGGGAAEASGLGSITTQLTSLLDQLRRFTPTPTSGGGATLAAATGSATLGPVDQLRLSVDDLVRAIGQLNLALQAAGITGGGAPAPKTEAPPVAPPKVDPPKTEAPKVEPPKTEVPSTSSGSGSDTTAPPASGSSSSS